MRAEDLVTKLIENDPDELNARDYVMSTKPWWKEIDAFTRAYMVAALWSTHGPPFGECPCCGRTAVLDRLPEPEYEQVPMCSADGCGVREASNDQPLDSNYDLEDIAPETVKSMSEDCIRFRTENAADLEVYAEHRETGEYTGEEAAGHDFWLSRNGHGAGFFDRMNVPEDVRDRLQEAAQRYGEVYLEVGDDGKIYSN